MKVVQPRRVLTNTRLDWKGFPGTNTLAYAVQLRQLGRKKSFITLTPVVNVLKPFLSLTDVPDQ
jgi:hypothetical protein